MDRLVLLKNDDSLLLERRTTEFIRRWGKIRQRCAERSVWLKAGSMMLVMTMVRARLVR